MSRKTHGIRFIPSLECLESKIVPTGNVRARFVSDSLWITGDNQANQISVVPQGTNGATITSLDGSTTINGQTLAAGDSITVTGRRDIRHLRVDMNGGDDVFQVSNFNLAHDF